jgi:carbon storage regulator
MNPHGWPPLAKMAGQAFFNLIKEVIVLVLSRTVNQEIVIGHDIRVMVIEVRGDKVRLGVTAPRDVSVHRHEVYEAIQREQAATDSDCD